MCENSSGPLPPAPQADVPASSEVPTSNSGLPSAAPVESTAPVLVAASSLVVDAGPLVVATSPVPALVLPSELPPGSVVAPSSSQPMIPQSGSEGTRPPQ